LLLRATLSSRKGKAEVKPVMGLTLGKSLNAGLEQMSDAEMKAFIEALDPAAKGKLLEALTSIVRPSPNEAGYFGSAKFVFKDAAKKTAWLDHFRDEESGIATTMKFENGKGKPVCLTLRVLESPDDSKTLYIYEEWVGPDDHQGYLGKRIGEGYFKQYFGLEGPIEGKPPTDWPWEHVETLAFDAYDYCCGFGFGNTIGKPGVKEAPNGATHFGTAEFTFKEEADLKAWLLHFADEPTGIAETAKFTNGKAEPVNKMLRIMTTKADKKKLYIYEEWVSQEDHGAYLGGRIGDGYFKKWFGLEGPKEGVPPAGWNWEKCSDVKFVNWTFSSGSGF